MDIDEFVAPEEMQRRYELLMDSLSAGSLLEEDLTERDLALIRKLFGERADDLEDLLENLRRMQDDGAR